MNDYPFQLGDTVKDKHTGFTGLMTARTEWLYGCTRVAIEAKELSKDGEVVQPQWFDIQRIELVEKAKAAEPPNEPPGGPKSDPQRRADQ